MSVLATGGRLCPAAAVNRAGIGACALRADAQPPLGDPGDRSATGAHGLDVDRRHADRQAVDRFSNVTEGCASRTSDMSALKAAHVQRNHVAESGCARHVRGPDRARRRPG
jgi:hypothetical protein